MNSSFELFRNKNKHFYRNYIIEDYRLQAKVFAGSGMEFVKKHRKDKSNYRV
jgi:hypothetical protein